MQYLGFALVFFTLIALVAGFIQHRKGKKILAAPFRKTGEIAINPNVADAKGTVSCEGAVSVHQAVNAPCSGTPCVYYEIEVIQEWSKTVSTENGVKTERGKTTLQTVKNGAVFNVDDGSGPMAVDPRQGMEVELDKSFEQAQSVAWGDVVFGQFQPQVPRAAGDAVGTSVKVIEKIVPPTGKLFVMGQLANQTITKPNGMLGKLVSSRKGRDALVGKTKRNATIGFVAGAAMFVPGLGLSIFAEPPAADTACNIVDESAPSKPCRGTIYNDDGKDVSFTTTQPGTYIIKAAAPEGKKIPLIAQVTVKDATTNKVVVEEAQDEGEVSLPAGTYKLNVKDSVPGSAARFKGGFSFVLSVKRTGVKAVPSAAPSSGSAPTVTSAVVPTASDKPVAKAAPPSTVMKGGTKPATSAPKPSSAPTASAAPPASSAAPASSAKKK